MPLKIIHTADWHLGQNFFDRDRLAEQERFLQFLLKTIFDEHADVLVIAGDVFDTANPPRAAEELYYNFITEVYKLGFCDVFIVGGNHDSAAHLDAPKKLLQNLHVSIVGSLPGNPSHAILEIEKNGVCLCVAAIPFLRDRDVRTAVEGESFDEITERTKAGILKVYANVAEDIAKNHTHCDFVLATGHLTALGGKISDSERSIHIGNLGSIGAAHFSSVFNYVALGHLHHPQCVGENNNIRYSGSPIPLSFSESSQKEIRLLSVEKDGTFTQKSISIPLTRRLIRLEGTPDEIESAIATIRCDESELRPWLEVLLTEGINNPAINEQLRQFAANQNLEILKVGRKQSLNSALDLNLAKSKAISEWKPLEVFQKRIEQYMGDTSPDVLEECFNFVLQQVEHPDENPQA